MFLARLYTCYILAICCVALSAQSASNVTTTLSGAPGVVPVFTSGTNIESSVITQSGGNVGMGTTNPKALIDTGAISSMNTPGAFSNAILNLYSSTGVGDYSQITYGYQPSRTYGAAYLGYVSVNSNSGGFGDLVFGTRSVYTDTQPSERVRITNTGNVGIGTTSPGAKLEVNGNVKLTSSSGASITFPDNTVQSTAWTGALGGGDYAESVELSGDFTKYEPGDVLEIDKYNPSRFMKSNEQYSTLVAGVYSTKPGIMGRRQTTSKNANEAPMAIVGIVPVKVSSENGAIEPGDLLVSSSIPGVAMKGTDRYRMLGAVIGKAMGALDAGTGIIEALLSLQ